MNSEQTQSRPQCLKHKKPAFFDNSNFNQSQIQEKFPCEKCCNLYLYINSQSRQKNRKENLLNEIKITNKQLQVLEQMLIFYENNIQKEIQSINMFIKDQQQILTKLERVQQSVIKNEEELKTLENDLYMIQKKLSIKFSDLSKVSNVEKFEIILKMKQMKDYNDSFSQNNQQVQQEFDIIPLIQTDHNKQCQAIAFSYDSRIMVAGYQNQIKVFQFQYKNLNEIQILDKHKRNVSYLQFMKSNKQFVSCSMDGQMIFWRLNSQNIWHDGQIIHDRQYSITCIKFNSDQNILVSSGVDCLVKIYRKSSKNIWDCFYKITCSSYIVDLSFNQNFSQLYVCEYNNVVSVINQVNYDNWNLYQQINIGKKILQIQSLSDQRFALLSEKSHVLQIYFKTEEGFKEIQQINLQFENFEDTSFHMRRLSNNSYSDCLLVCGGQQFHILKNANQKVDLIFTQKTPAILNYARMSEDRKYLSYWEKQSNKIQIMRLS